jgi:hypothetical protein
MAWSGFQATLLILGLAAFGCNSSQKVNTWTGTICDENGKDQRAERALDCRVRLAARQRSITSIPLSEQNKLDARYVLVSNEKVYGLKFDPRLAEFAGTFVRVKGVEERDDIVVTSIEHIVKKDRPSDIGGTPGATR